MLIGHLTALFTVFIWGITFISTKILLAYFSAQEILFIRFFLGWLSLWAIHPFWLNWQGAKTEAIFAAAGLFGVTLYFLLENIALNYTLASNVGVIVSSAPFFTALVAWLFFGFKRPGTRFYAGFILAMLGIAIISFKDANLELNPKGDILALLAAFAWGFYSVITKKLTALQLGVLRTTRRIFFYGLLFIGPVFSLTGFNWQPALFTDPVVLGNILFLGLGASAICFVTWTFCLIRLGTEAASAYIYLVPVITVAAAAIWLHEKIGPITIGGMILVILGLILSEWKAKKRGV